MMTYQRIGSYVTAEPFRPFREMVDLGADGAGHATSPAAAPSAHHPGGSPARTGVRIMPSFSATPP